MDTYQWRLILQKTNYFLLMRTKEKAYPVLTDIEMKGYYPIWNCQETSEISTIQFLILIFFMMPGKQEKKILKRQHFWL